MFCPSCGSPNPDDAKFCNQCGWRLAPPTQQGEAPQRAPTRQGVSPEGGSSQGARSQQGDPSLSGLSTHDMAAAMVQGPSKRSMVIGGMAIGAAGLALGAVLAWKQTRLPEAPPVTPVGLIGDPSPVSAPQTEENDAGTIVPVDPARRPTATATARAPRPANVAAAPVAPARPTAARPTAPTPARPSNPTPPSGERTASGNTIVRDDNGNTTVLGADGQPLVQLSRGAPQPTTDPAPEAPERPSNPSPAPTTPAAENGVIERGPRTSAGGYHLGEETDATGTMDPQAFQFVYRHYQSQIAACWQTASRSHEVSGVMVVRVRVAEADGHVSRTRVVSDSTHDASLQACVQNAIRGWRYPRPEGGDVEVDYPLRFGTTTR